jgi:hypothetical protein
MYYATLTIIRAVRTPGSNPSVWVCRVYLPLVVHSSVPEALARCDVVQPRHTRCWGFASRL